MGKKNKKSKVLYVQCDQVKKDQVIKIKDDEVKVSLRRVRRPGVI